MVPSRSKKTAGRLALIAGGIVRVPLDEAAHALGDRRLRPETDRSLQIGNVRASLVYVTRLHRRELADRGFAKRLFEQTHTLRHGDRRLIADIVDAPWREARGRVRSRSVPGRISLCRAANEPHDGLGHIVDISEVPLHLPIVDQEDRPPL